ncbi:hypothetical protein PENSPDRAFT_693946 [Peniophora sp. CONT]|nr:hypothetical protein PENSPDRAFT_693946 [Peniophora sp. CONT]
MDNSGCAARSNKSAKTLRFVADLPRRVLQCGLSYLASLLADRHRRLDEEVEEELDEDDLDLMEEKTGETFKRSKHKRLRRGRKSDPPPAASSSKRRNAILFDVYVNAEDVELPSRGGIRDIWTEDEDEDDFIHYDEEKKGVGGMDEAEREQLREKRRQEKRRRQVMRSRPERSWIVPTCSVTDMTMTGLEGEKDGEYYEATASKEMICQDVFESSEVRACHLTEDDDIVRAHNISKRTRLATSALSEDALLSVQHPMTEETLDGTVTRVIMRLSKRKEREFGKEHISSMLLYSNIYYLPQLGWYDESTSMIKLPTTNEPCHLLILFRTIGDDQNRFELLYANIRPLLAELLENFSAQLMVSGFARDLVVELCLKTSSIEIRKLELFIDNLIPECLDPTLNTVYLIEFGGRNRRLLDLESEMDFRHYALPVIGIWILLDAPRTDARWLDKRDIEIARTPFYVLEYMTGEVLICCRMVLKVSVMLRPMREDTGEHIDQVFPRIVEPLSNTIVQTEAQIQFSAECPFARPINNSRVVPVDATVLLVRKIHLSRLVRTCRSVLQIHLAPALACEIATRTHHTVDDCLTSSNAALLSPALQISKDLEMNWLLD